MRLVTRTEGRREEEVAYMDHDGNVQQQNEHGGGDARREAEPVPEGMLLGLESLCNPCAHPG